MLPSVELQYSLPKGISRWQADSICYGWLELCEFNHGKQILTVDLLPTKCCLLITFANSLDLDQAQQNVGAILIQTV